MIKVSIIVPVYNVDKFLVKCLDSLINQTLRDIEIICVNDGSTDKSLSILEHYQEIDPRVIIINQQNCGQGVARNNGIKVAKGEYIGFVDSDDFVELNMYECLYEQAKRYDSDIVESIPLKCVYKFPENKPFTLKEYPSYLYKSFMWVWPSIYKNDFIKQNHIYFDNGRMGEDRIFKIKAKIYAKSIVLIKKLLYHYIYYKTSSSHSYNESAMRIFEQYNEQQDLLKKNNIFHLVNNDFINWFFMAMKENYTITPLNQRKQFLRKFKSIFPIKMYIKFRLLTCPLYHHIIRPMGKYLVVLPIKRMKFLTEQWRHNNG